MKLTHIITLANRPVEIIFRAFERSLRASGCNLPLYVIPFNDDKFELPDNAQWLDDQPLFDLLAQNNSHPMMRKYAAFTRENYLFVDTDVIFLQNPESYYAPYEGFVANCTHWNNPHHTTSEASAATFAKQTTTWPRFVFNAGQFASSQKVFADFDALKAACMTQPQTTLTFPWHDQPGINYLVRHSKVPFTNITLPPHQMESSWAGDYLEKESIELSENSPCFLHWAGFKITGEYPIDQLFLSHVDPAMRTTFLETQYSKPSLLGKVKAFGRGVKRSWKEAFGR